MASEGHRTVPGPSPGQLPPPSHRVARREEQMFSKFAAKKLPEMEFFL